MSAPPFPNSAEYLKRWHAMTIPASTLAHAQSVAKIILLHKTDFDAVETVTGVPWFWLGPILYREADLDFSCHLANGDPLTHDTVHVPAHLMAPAKPPYTWPQAAVASLEHEKLQGQTWGTLAEYLWRAEAYNGWGYRLHNIASPYLWSGTSEYNRGKYVADGKWSSTAKDEQLGVVPILKAIMDTSVDITFSDL